MYYYKYVCINNKNSQLIVAHNLQALHELCMLVDGILLTSNVWKNCGSITWYRATFKNRTF
jgi:hypothetical protein